MATGSQPNSVFYGVYDKYVGEARTKPEVYGYWVLIPGLLAAIVGVAVLLLGQTRAVGLSSAMIRRIGLGLAGSGSVGLLLGLVLQLPLRRRAIYLSVLGALVSLASVGVFVRIYTVGWQPGGTTQSLAVVGGYVGGLSVVVLMAALIPVVTGRRSLLLAEEPAEELAWVIEDDEEPNVSDVLLGESTRDGVFAVFPTDGGWRWRFVEQTAVADGRSFENQSDAESGLEAVKSKVTDAGLLELNHAAFRLYRDGSESVRWTLVDESGVVLADSDGRYSGRQKAESAVNLLKEHGPGAALLDVDGGAFEVYGDGDSWRWRLVDENRGILGTGPDGYDERSDAESVVVDVREAAQEAPLMDVQQVGFELLEGDDGWHWQLVDSDDTTIATANESCPTKAAVTDEIQRIAESAIDMPFLTAGTPAYEVVEGPEGGWHWRLLDEDDTTVAASEKAVPSAESGRSVVSRVKDIVTDAEVLTLGDAEFEIYADGDDWAWRLVTEDRETIARSPPGETYETTDDASAAVGRVREEIEQAERIEFDSAAFHLYEADDGGWNVRLVDSDGSVISDSGQEHASREDAAASMTTMKDRAPDAELVEIESAALECYEAEGEWHWRLVDATGDTLATSPGRLAEAAAAHEAMDTLELLAPDADARVMDAGVFQVYTGDAEGQWRWRLLHPDGSLVATSVEGYSAQGEAWHAAEDVLEFADEATVHTISDLAVRFSVEREEVDDDDAEPTERWEWELVDRSRSVLATGTEQFPSRDAVAATARLVRDNAGAASVFQVEPAAFRLDEVDGEEGDPDGWRWRLLDPDRETLAVGSRVHDARESARTDLSRVRELAGGAGLLDFDLAAFEVTEREGGWVWQFVDTDGNVIGVSGPDFDSRAAAERAVAEIRDRLSAASLLEIESPAFELHEDDGQWRWRLVDTDGSTVAESMRAYPTRREARKALSALREFGGDAATEVAG